MQVDETTWAEIRRVWQETNEGQVKIAARFNVGHSTIGQRAIKERWGPRPKAARVIPLSLTDIAAATADRPAASAVAKAPPRQRPRRPPDTPQARAAKLLRLIDLQIDSMERTMATGEPMSAQDQERHARASGALGAQAEALTDTLASMDKPANDGREQHADAYAEAQRIRREIVERLERLHSQRLAARRSGPAQ